MKTVINIVLAVCAVALVYVCYGSIMGPINFDNTKKAREEQVIARLIDIRKAQVEYRNTHEGVYTASFDTLIDFVNTRAEKRSLYDQAFGAVMFYTTTSCAEDSYFADVEVLWEETYKPQFEEKIYG